MDDTVGNPHRAQIFQFEFFELDLLSRLDKQVSAEQFEPTVSQSTVPSPLLHLPARVLGNLCLAAPTAGRSWLGREAEQEAVPSDITMYSIVRIRQPYDI